MPVPKTNKEPKTIEEFILGAEEWGDTEIFSEETLKGYIKRMMEASDNYDCTFESRLSKSSKKIVVTVYHNDMGKAEQMADILAGAFTALNGLLNEIFRLRAEVRRLT
jgi:hypothetical protein